MTSPRDLRHTEETEGAVIREDISDDPYQIKRQLAYHIGSFTRCKTCHYSGQNRQALYGVEEQYRVCQLVLGNAGGIRSSRIESPSGAALRTRPASPRIVSSSFVLGCVSRIGDRLRELTPRACFGYRQRVGGVAQRADRRGHEEGRHQLRKASSRSRRVDTASYGAGKTAGNAARFDRPVSTAGGAPRLGEVLMTIQTITPEMRRSESAALTR